MTGMDKPFPDLTEVMEMARILDTSDESKTATEVEEEITRYVDRIRDEVAQKIHSDILADGDSAALMPALRWLQASLIPLFQAGEMLRPEDQRLRPEDQRLRYLSRLMLTIMAVYNIGAFTRLTKTAQKSAAARAGQRAGQKKLQKVRPLIKDRRTAVNEINATLPRHLGWKDREAKINEGLRARGIKGVDRRTLQRDLAPRD